MISVLAVAAAAVFPAFAGQKLLVVMADFGDKSVPREIVDTLKRHPGLRLTVPYAAAQKTAEDLKILTRDKRIESAVTLADEPFLPFLVNMSIAAPLEITFAWPQDAWDIVVRGREELLQSFPQSGRGLFLRSGCFSSALIPELKRLGIRWARIVDESGTHQGCSISDGFMMLAPVSKRFSTDDECWQWIAGRPEDIVVLSFGEDNPLTAALLRGLAGRIDDGTALMMTPEQVYAEARDRAIPAGDWNPEPDRSRWQKVPMVWYHLGHARQAIEEYKNSGTAKLPQLEQLRGQIFKLYNYRLITRLQDASDVTAEMQFLGDINRIFATLNLPPGEAMPDVAPSTMTAREFTVTPSSSGVSFVNSGMAGAFGIDTFSVSAGSDTVVYRVTFTSAPPAGTVVDIYMDLNNQEGAGLTRLLPGLEAFMEVRDAWEFAVRIEGDQAALYRSGRFEATLVRKFPVREFNVDVPRSILRGNVVNWGYQSVASVKNATGGFDALDFLCADEPTRKHLKEQSPLQLPALRAVPRPRPGE